MTDSIIKKPLNLAVGIVFTVALSGAGALVQAADNPFAMQELSDGYLTDAEEGKCGEGACGDSDDDSDSDVDVEGSCGEGACGETEEEPTEDEDTEEEV